MNPLFGHSGFGGDTGGSEFHYEHHTKKNWNFGGTPMYDRLFGTFKAHREAEEAAKGGGQK